MYQQPPPGIPQGYRPASMPPAPATAAAPSPPPLVHPVPVPASRTAQQAAQQAQSQPQNQSYTPIATPGPSAASGSMSSATATAAHPYMSGHMAPSPAPSVTSSMTGGTGTPAPPVYMPAGYQNQYQAPSQARAQQQPATNTNPFASAGYAPIQPQQQHPWQPTPPASSMTPASGSMMGSGYGLAGYAPVPVPTHVTGGSVGGARAASPAMSSHFGSTMSMPAAVNVQQQQQQQQQLSGSPAGSASHMGSMMSMGSGFGQQQQGYTQQQQQSQQYGQSYGQSMQQQQQQQQQGGQQFTQNLAQAFAPAFGGFINDPAAQIGLQLGSKAMHAGQEYVNQNLGRYVNVPHLKYYFNVSNSYVLNKLRLVLFPFRQSHWHRTIINAPTATPAYPSPHMPHNPYAPQPMATATPQPSGTPGGSLTYRPPREDLLSPDLYIPVMAFVTYVLLIGYELGMRNKFHPRELGMTASTAFFLVLLEILLVKLGCYLFSVTPGAPMLDLVAYAGYKFVGIIAVTLAAMVLPSWGFWATLGYMSLATGFFALRSMKYIVIPESLLVSAGTGHIPQRKRRSNFLVAVVAVQVAVMWVLVPWAGTASGTKRNGGFVGDAGGLDGGAASEGIVGDGASGLVRRSAWF
ncbi:YIF1-domain-containing protein [Catenaria anguillulae PL171]|uniref:YIF1-domain-containing protein n=1 Tax=Catenaria anguillulae PL171 TaxID=765915 RepID=A0A1Y2HDH6_9FUNG|nr:YIF1-domain-containing protein [Catenaria anguillulae PL171]